MRLTAFELSAVDIPSQGSVSATVRLDEPAPVTGVNVLIGSSDARIKCPHKVVVAPGQTFKTFTITADTLQSLQVFQVWAQVRETVFRQKLLLRQPGIADLYFTPNVVDGGLTVTLELSLDSPAPANGALVRLSEILNYGGYPLPLITDLPSSIYVASGVSTASAVVTTLDWDGGRMPPPRQTACAVDAVYNDSIKRAILTVTDP